MLPGFWIYAASGLRFPVKEVKIMLMLKVCHACDGILGEIEVGEDLTHDVPDSIMNVIDNVAYTLCPDCLRLLESESGAIYH